jgi:hypothetical protein
MRACILGLVGWLALTAGVQAGDVRLDYSHAGLTRVTVDEQHRLHYSWHTGRQPFDQTDNSPMRQSLEAYDSHSAVIWLTRTELGRFQDWVEKNGIFDLPATYPEKEPPTYGSAFQSELAIELGDRKQALKWTGDSQVPDSLRAAIDQLMKLCEEIRKSRE